MKKLALFASTAVLVGLIGCSSSSNDPAPTPTPKATKLVYTDPTGSGYLLKRNNASTDTHLILDLYGPAGTKGRGISFDMTVDTTKVSMAKVATADAEYIQAGTVFDLGTGVKLMKGAASGSKILAGIHQKGAGNAKDLGGKLLSVAIDFNSGASLNQGTAITNYLTFSKIKLLPETGTTTTDISSIGVGTLVAQ